MDRGKVIKGLECCNYYGFHEDCPYDKKDPNEEQDTTCMMDLMRDALELLKKQNSLMLALEQSNAVNEYLNAEVERLNGLLKEQEAVKPVRDEQTGRIWLCGNCGTYVGFEDNDPHDPNEFDKYCRECGKPVLWEGR